MFAVRRFMLAHIRRMVSATDKIFEMEDIVPTLIDVAPIEVAQVTYSSGAKVILGNQLTPTEVKDMPLVEWTAEKNAFYMLCMIDADAPSRENPEFREWRHWLVGNIPEHVISKGETLSKYTGPPVGTGLHRYVFLIYKQAGKLEFDTPDLIDICNKRGKLSIRELAKKFKLGQPIAGNFYQAQYDSDDDDDDDDTSSL